MGKCRLQQLFNKNSAASQPEVYSGMASRYRQLVEHSPDIVYSCDPYGSFIFANARFSAATGISAQDIFGKSINAVTRSERTIYLWRKAFEIIRRNGEAEAVECEWGLHDSGVHLYSIHLSPVFDSRGKLVEICGTNHDITDIRHNEAAIGRLAHYDALTGLPNRLLFLERLNIAIHHATRAQSKLAVIFLDFDNFKKVNDTLGHAAGDEFIQTVSHEMSRVLRREETLARLSGDEFVIFIQDIKNEDSLSSFIERIKTVFSRSYRAGRNMIHVSSSIGIALFPDHGAHCEELIANADAAMYKAKESGKNNVQLYDRRMRDDVFKRLTLEGHLGNALKNGEFLLHYQPQVDAATGVIRGCEALLRWSSPELGPVQPQEFIKLAEETGFIIPIGEWVLKAACRQNLEWNRALGTPYVISVNVSSLQLKQPNFLETVTGVLAATGMSASQLELEITESILIDSFDVIIKTLDALKQLGVRISLDDFGAGYSSISYLKKLPLDTLKIDKSFIENIRHGKTEKEIIKTIISLVHKLGISIVAEGVETKAQLAYLMDARCDYLQGYHLCQPKSAEDVEALLAQGHINLSALLDYNFTGQYI